MHRQRDTRLYEFLRVDDFLCSELDARAIRSGFETRFLEALAAEGPLRASALAAKTRKDSVGLRLLAGQLEGNRVIAREGDLPALTSRFREALRFRDLLETRIDFADLVWPDIHALFAALLADLSQFMARSKVFELFRYDRCMEVTPANLAASRTWVRLTAGLTTYESIALLDAVDLGLAQRPQ